MFQYVIYAYTTCSIMLTVKIPSFIPRHLFACKNLNVILITSVLGTRKRLESAAFEHTKIIIIIVVIYNYFCIICAQTEFYKYT